MSPEDREEAAPRLPARSVPRRDGTLPRHVDMSLRRDRTDSSGTALPELLRYPGGARPRCSPLEAAPSSGSFSHVSPPSQPSSLPAITTSAEAAVVDWSAAASATCGDSGSEAPTTSPARSCASELSVAIADEVLMCKVCYVSFGDANVPRLLTCSHTFCETCLQRHADASSSERDLRNGVRSALRCPLCRAETRLSGGVESLPVNFTVMNLLEILRRKPIVPPRRVLSATIHGSAASTCVSCARRNVPLRLECGHATCRSCSDAAGFVFGTNDSATADGRHFCPSCKTYASLRDAAATSVTPSERPPPFNPEYASRRSFEPTCYETAPLMTSSECRAVLGFQSATIARERRSQSCSLNPPPVPPPRRLHSGTSSVTSLLLHIRTFGHFGETTVPIAGRFRMPSRIAVAENERVVVVDSQAMHVHILTSHGNQFSAFRVAGVQDACFVNKDRIAVATHRGVDVYNIYGENLHRLDSTPDGLVFGVCEFRFGFVSASVSGVCVFRQSLTLSQCIPRRRLNRRSLFGRKWASFCNLRDVAVTSDRHIVLLEGELGRLVIIDEDGATVRIIDPSLEPCGRLRQAQSITCDTSNNVIVADTGNQRVLSISSTGPHSRVLLSLRGVDTERQLYPYGVAVSAAGRLFVTLAGDFRAEIRVYQL